MSGNLVAFMEEVHCSWNTKNGQRGILTSTHWSQPYPICSKTHNMLLALFLESHLRLHVPLNHIFKINVQLGWKFTIVLHLICTIMLLLYVLDHVYVYMCMCVLVCLCIFVSVYVFLFVCAHLCLFVCVALFTVLTTRQQSLEHSINTVLFPTHS